jgi:putative SOS response-associated peptidase YedK
MCGRFAITSPPEAVRRYFGYRDEPDFPTRADIRPTEPVPVVHLLNGERRFQLMRWGFIPGFVKDERDFPLLFNARAETLFEKASFRNAIRRRRCLFFADSFTEWQRLDEKGRRKRAFTIRRPMGGLMAFAGIWECWQSPNGSEIDTAAIVTTSANATLAAIHERMPVILDPRDFDAWLAPETIIPVISRLLAPPGDDGLEIMPVEAKESPRGKSSAQRDREAEARQLGLFG